MDTVEQIVDFMDQFAPRELAADWDNVGLLLGDPTRKVKRIMTCLTVTPQSADEAVEEQADLIIAHHPLPFRPLKRITNESIPGQLVLRLIENRVALLSPHTCFDSASLGINQMLAEGLELQEIRPLVPIAELAEGLGSGRWGNFTEPQPLSEVAGRLQRFLKIRHMHRVGDPQRPIARVAVGCGSAGEFLGEADRLRCDLLVTGETNFHTCLEAQALDVCLLLPGHYASERFAVEQLAITLQTRFPEQQVWASRREQDPVNWE